MRALDIACTWTAAAAAGQGFAGVLLALAVNTPLFAWWNEPIAQVLWNAPEPPAEVVAYRGWLCAVLGGTMASWGLCAAALAWVPLRRGERWAGLVIIASLAVWFPLDTLASWQIGHTTNVILNVCATLAFVPGLAVAMRKEKT